MIPVLFPEEVHDARLVVVHPTQVAIPPVVKVEMLHSLNLMTTNVHEETTTTYKETANAQEETSNANKETTNAHEEIANAYEETTNANKEAINAHEETTNDYEETAYAHDETTNCKNFASSGRSLKISPHVAHRPHVEQHKYAQRRH